MNYYDRGYKIRVIVKCGDKESQSTEVTIPEAFTYTVVLMTSNASLSAGVKIGDETYTPYDFTYAWYKNGVLSDVLTDYNIDLDTDDIGKTIYATAAPVSKEPIKSKEITIGECPWLELSGTWYTETMQSFFYFSPTYNICYRYTYNDTTTKWNYYYGTYTVDGDKGEFHFTDVNNGGTTKGTFKDGELTFDGVKYSKAYW